MIMSRFLALPLALAMLTAANTDPATAADEKSGDEMTPVSLRLNWQMKGEFTPLIVAAEKGFFAAEGLDVSVNEGKGATQALQTVASGQDDIAYVPSIQLIKGVNEGMPVKAIATVVKIEPMGMVSKSKIELSSPSDLEGRTVGISAASTFSQIWEAFARTNDIDVSQVNVVRAEPAARFSLLLGDEIDILADIFMTNEYPVLQERVDEPLNTLRVGDWGFPLLGYTLVTNEDWLNDRPELLERFLAGAMKGFQFTIDNPDEAATIAVQAYPDALRESTTKGQIAQLVDFLERGEPRELFIGDDEGWERTVEILSSSGAIDERKSVDAYYTNDFVPGAQ